MSESGKSVGQRAFEYAADTRKMEIGLFWQRSVFFWGFISAAFIAYAAARNASTRDDDLILAIASFGIICSVAWTLANRGSKYWQNVWEAKLEYLEKQDLKAGLFTAAVQSEEMKRHPWGIWSKNWHFSVSRLAIALSDFSVVIWIVLACKATNRTWPSYLNGPTLIPILTAIYVCLMLIGCRSESKPKNPLASQADT